MFEKIKEWFQGSNVSEIKKANLRRTNSYYKNLGIVYRWQKEYEAQQKELKRQQKAKKK